MTAPEAAQFDGTDSWSLRNAGLEYDCSDSEETEEDYLHKETADDDMFASGRGVGAYHKSRTF